MNRNRLVATAVVVAALIAGWWWRRERAPQAPPAASAGSAAPSVEARREQRERAGDVESGRAIVIDDDPPGTLRLEGQVVDADGHGVGGATVVIAANPPRTALTEADGGFAFDGLVGRPYTLIARAAQGAAGPVTARLTEKSDPVVLRLRPAGRLTVTVVGSNHKLLDGATVELRGLDVVRATVAGKPAVFTPVVPGDYQVAAWAAGMAHAFQRIRIGTGDAQVRLTLASGAPVTGRVVDDRGAAIANARVRYAGSDGSQQASAQLDGAVTGADGSFRFAALPAGSFRFVATHPERAPGTSPLVTLDGRTAHDGVVITLAVGAVVRGRVVDAQRHPIAAAQVRIGPAERGRGRQLDGPRQGYSDAQGRFELRGLPRTALSAVALHETGASQVVAVDTTAGDVGEVVLTLDVTGTISGVVVDPQGQPVEGAQVSAGPAFGAGRPPIDPAQLRLRGLPQELTDAAGRFTLTGLLTGSYQISASPARAQGRGRGRARDGITATTGDTNVRLVLEPDGGVRGRVAFSDGTVPELFTVGVQQIQQGFGGGDGAFVLDGLAPSDYELTVRGPSFETQAIAVTVASNATADVGTITVVKGRSIGGTVVADGQAVEGATVYAGRSVFGNGTTSAAPGGGGPGGPGPGGPAVAAFGGATKTTTTDAAGAFSLSGFSDGDLTLVAERDDLGRSRALRLPSVMPGQTELTITLEKFGALSGVLHQSGTPATGVVVTCQSTSTPGAVYTVPAGPDGGYRFDRLAPDTYKVSATLITRRVGMRFYSKQVDVPAGKEVSVDLAVDAGTVSLGVASVARSGTVGMAIAWLATGAITARTASELSLKLAAAGPGASQRVTVRNGEPAQFTEVVPGAYSACITPLPLEVRGFGAIGYFDRHGDTLPTFCASITVAAAPDTQTAQLNVEIPAFIDDSAGSGSGSGLGRGTGSGSGR